MNVTQVTASPPLQSTGPTTTPTLSILTPPGITASFLAGHMASPSGLLKSVSTHIGWFNVKDDFGASGDGSSPDEGPIQNAIDAAYTAIAAAAYRCGIIFFPPGAYNVGGTLNIPRGGTGSSGGGLLFLGCGGQAESSSKASRIIANFPGDLFVINVSAGGGGVTFRDIGINRLQSDGMTPQPSGVTFRFDAVTNACITNVFTEGDHDVFRFSQPGMDAVNEVYIFGNTFKTGGNRFFHWIGGGTSLHIWNNYIGGFKMHHDAGSNFVGHFDFSMADACDAFFFRNNDIEAFAGGIYFSNTTGALRHFWIQGNLFDIGQSATKPCFHATASGSAQVIEGHIENNWMALGNGILAAPNAIHLDASGGNGSQVAGIHIIGNVFGGGILTTPARGAAIHIANGASDITVIGGRANYETNAIEVVGSSGTTDGIAIVGFGANQPTNGYNPGVNQTGVAIKPSTGMTVQNVSISGCNLGGCATSGLVVSTAGGGTVNGVTAIGNAFWGYSSPTSAITITGLNITNVHVANNPGYDPVGYTGSPPPIATGMAIKNPFAQAARIVIVSSAITSVSITSASGGSPITTGLVPRVSGLLVVLGVGEAVTLGGSLGTGSSWQWFLS